MFDVAKSDTQNPVKAVVIMYGWMGSKLRHIEKFAKLYTERDCTVVYGKASTLAIMRRDRNALKEAVLESVKESAKILREQNSKEIPVILHYISNGGAFLAERLEQLVEEMKNGNEDSSLYADLNLVVSRLKSSGFVVCDSAPAYLSVQSAMAAIDSSISNMLVRICVKVVMRLIIAFHDFAEKYLDIASPREKFWANAIDSNLCERQAFLYSSNDALTDHEKIDELIEERKKRGINVIFHKFEDSDHVMHLRKYPKEYNSFIDKILLSVNKIKTH